MNVERLARQMERQARALRQAHHERRVADRETILNAMQGTMVDLEDATGEDFSEPDVQRAFVLRAVRRGRYPDDDDAFTYFTPSDIRDASGQFLPKVVRERIYRAWQDGSREDVSFFLSFVPLLSVSPATVEGESF